MAIEIGNTTISLEATNWGSQSSKSRRKVTLTPVKKWLVQIQEWAKKKKYSEKFISKGLGALVEFKPLEPRTLRSWV